MFAFLKRAVVILVGFLLIALFIWFVGPYFAFAEYHPLQSASVRVGAIAGVVLAWLLVRLAKRLRAFQVSDKLMAAVSIPRRSAPEPVSPEAAKLRERFEEAVGRLSAKRRSGHSLYELPWYVIIGAPASGKTTALTNSGLNFPLDQKGSRAALPGVAGTRNCDWLFTNEAVFLDTAGRYTTQDSDAESDSAGWREFLGLLKKYRVRRPINGVILTISVPDLLMRDHVMRESYVDAARRRLDELHRELRIELPVYLMVTKCDLIAGFSEFFEDLDVTSRSQVWGVTFPYEQSAANEGPDRIAGELDELLARLNERVLPRMEQVRDVRRRGLVFGFPQQFATIREPIVQYVSDVFAASRFDRQVLLRGVYFTSGTQDGTPIDRVLGSMARRFGATDSVLPPSGPGKSYFTADLLQQVIIAESGLAGVNRQLEAKKVAAQLAAYAAMGLIAAAGVTLAYVSYARNRQFLASTATQIAAVEATPRVNADSPLEAIVARLDAIRLIVDSADLYRLDTWWPVRWGLYQGRVIGNVAGDAYLHHLDSVVLPRLGTLLAARMLQYRSQPAKLFDYWKAYLMLGTPAHVDKEYLRSIAEAEWKAASSAQTGARLTFHFNHLLDRSDGLRALALDDRLVTQARATLTLDQLGVALYQSVKHSHSATVGTLRLDQVLGFDAQKVFRRRSGTSLSEPLPPFYTREVFKQVVHEVQSGLVPQLALDAWMWGDSLTASIAGAKGVDKQVIDLYEKDYIEQWEGLLADLEFVPQGTVSGTSEALRIIAGPTSPLTSLLRVVAAHTMLVESKDPKASPAPPPGMFGQFKKRAEDLLKRTEVVAGLNTGEPGRLVTTRFDWVRVATAGEPGQTQLDAVLRMVGDTQRQLAAAGNGITDVDVTQILSSREFQAQLQALHEQADTLAPELSALLLQITRASKAVVTGGATAEIEKAYADRVVRPCHSYIAGRYPFADTEPEVQMEAFGDVFGYGGIFDSFYKNFLAEHVETNGDSWRWRPDTVQLSSQVLDTFREALSIRNMFFKPESTKPEIHFNVIVTEIDRATTRFVLQIDGVRTEQVPGPTTSRSMSWPGPTPGANEVAFVAERHQPYTPYPTPWGWLRLVDAGGGSADDQQRVRFRISNPPHHANVVIEPRGSGLSPFADKSWRTFSCPS